MTRDEILNMEAGREMDALVAEKVMGWQWVKYPAPNMSDGTRLTAIIPPPVSGRIYANHYNLLWKPSDATAKRFSDWDDFTYWDDDGATRHRGLPHYSTDIAAAWLVVEKFTDAELSKAGNGYQVSFNVWAIANAPTAPLAICRAALLATLEN